LYGKRNKEIRKNLVRMRRVRLCIQRKILGGEMPELVLQTQQLQSGDNEACYPLR